VRFRGLLCVYWPVSPVPVDHGAPETALGATQRAQWGVTHTQVTPRHMDHVPEALSRCVKESFLSSPETSPIRPPWTMSIKL